MCDFKYVQSIKSIKSIESIQYHEIDAFIIIFKNNKLIWWKTILHKQDKFLLVR
jgi:hypothetical protein